MAAMLHNPLTVVEAPMGSGKTESVRAFLAAAPVRVVWTTAQASMAETFWPEFCRELAKAAPKSSRLTSELLRLGFPDDQARISEALKILEEVAFARKTVLVFDDCHLLPRTFIAFCEGLARLASFNAEIVAITRHSWGSGPRFVNTPFSISRLDPGLFALNAGEIREYFELCGAPITAEQAHELRAGTDGWFSALYLNMLSYKRNGDFSGVPEEISDRMREMVYAPLSEGAKALLLVLTPLERFTAAQATHLYGAGTPPLLEELTGKNSFVSFDPASRVYSPHAVFRKLLQEMLDAPDVAPKRRRAIYKACGEELMAAGELASAMEAWYRAGDFERALTVLESDMTRNLVTERAEFYITLYRECPESVLVRHIGACFKFAIALFSAGDFAAYEAQLGQLAERCAALPPGEEADGWRG